jgi:hypothetical protein
MKTLIGFCRSLTQKPTEQREGQYLVNVLWAYDRDAGDAIHSTQGDCFYDDSKILEFWKFLGSYYGDKEGVL